MGKELKEPKPETLESPEALAFQCFLERLAPEPEEAGRRYVKMRGQLLRYFVMKGDTFPDEAADETIDRIVARINEGVLIDELWPYCLGVARLVGLERFRKNKREQQAWMVFADKVALTYDEAKDDSYHLMLKCLLRLEESERQLLIDYCRPLVDDELNEFRSRLAEERGLSLNQLRLRVYRLRSRLLAAINSPQRADKPIMSMQHSQASGSNTKNAPLTPNEELKETLPTELTTEKHTPIKASNLVVTPRNVQFILACLWSRELCEVQLGDFDEQYAKVHKRVGAKLARRWAWMQVFIEFRQTIGWMLTKQLGKWLLFSTVSKAIWEYFRRKAG